MTVSGREQEERERERRRRRRGVGRFILSGEFCEHAREMKKEKQMEVGTTKNFLPLTNLNMKKSRHRK